MNETLTIFSERVDDIPLLLAQMARMGVQPLLDTHFPTHGNWQGLSLGWVTVIWLTHILSQADHRLNHVEPWAEKRLHTLRGCTSQPLHPLDVSDDRLALVLQALSDDTRWSTFESALTQQLVRVYALRPERVRLDSTTASGSWAVTPEGLFQFGHSKDHRPDLPQVKVMMSSLIRWACPWRQRSCPGTTPMTRCISPPSGRCAPAWGSADCCTWGIVNGGAGDARVSPRGAGFLSVPAVGAPGACRPVGLLPGARLDGGAGRHSHLSPPGRPAPRNRLPRATSSRSP